MRTDKINMTMEEYIENGPINIVAFGDSVTHGALLNEINYETVYWNILKKKLNKVRSYVPVNVICAGVGGITAKGSLGRMDKQVLSHSPDLVIVCFGLNDVNGTLEEYISSLEEIFERCKKSGTDVIFMTPNMLNTRVADDAPEQYLEYAKITAEYQNGGRMDLYMNSAVELADKMGVTVCDCYAKWKAMHEAGVNVTELLSNKINHPTREMNWLFAMSLVETMLS